MSIISTFITYLENLATKVPLELFTVVGSFVEEIIAPIPSPLVMTLAGSITKAQGNTLIYIFFIAIIGAISKTVGSWIIYFVSDKAEDIVIKNFGRFFGVTHDEVEKIGKYFSGTKRDFFTITFLRALPVMSTALVSIGCGVIKVNLSTYIFATFVGCILRNIFFLYLGYTGLAASESLVKGLESTETLLQILAVVLVGGLLLYGYWKRRKGLLPDVKTTNKNENNVNDEKTAKDLLDYKKVDPMPKTESDTRPTVYIFRHGQTTDNAQYIFSGWRDVEITEKGKEQALILADKLKNKKIDMLISSPQKRAIQTMEIAISKNENAKNLPIQTDERIKERSYGDLQGKSKMEIQMQDPEKLQKIRRSFSEAPANGESIEMVCKRVEDFCNWLVPMMKEKGVNVAISCHGNSIRGFRRYFENLSNEETAKVETPLGEDYAAYVIS